MRYWFKHNGEPVQAFDRFRGVGDPADRRIEGEDGITSARARRQAGPIDACFPAHAIEMPERAAKCISSGEAVVSPNITI